MKHLLLAASLLCLAPPLFAQNQKLIDSLEQVLSQSKEDTNKVILLTKTGFQHVSYDVAKAESLLNEAIQLSKKLGYLRGEAAGYGNMGIVYKNKKKFDSSVYYHNKALVIWQKLNAQKNIATAYNGLGRTYTEKGDYTSAMDYFLKALKIRQQLNDTAGMAAAYNNIGNIYFNKRDFEQSKEWSRKSMLLMMMKGDSFEVARNVKEIGYCFQKLQKYDSALVSFKRSLNIFRQAGDKVESARIMNNIGIILVETKQISEGIAYHEDALNMQLETNDSLGIFTSKIALGQAYENKGDYNLAKKNADEALAILNASGGQLEMYTDIYQVQSDIYRKMGDYKNALEAYSLFVKFNDSLIKLSNSSIVSDMVAKYDSDRKDLELKNTTYKLRQRQLIIGSLGMVIILIVLSSYLLYNRYRLRKQKELDEELIKQQEIRNKAIIDAEERERVRIAKDLHDGVGQQLAAVKLNMNAMEEELLGNITQLERLKTLEHMVDEALKEVRAVSHNMMPNALMRKGLAAAVREFIDNIAATGLLHIDLHVVGMNERLDGTMETVLYRVLQEIVSNIIKHAQANKVSIQLIRHEDYLNFILEDNGKGFDARDVNHFNGIGLKNIISRIQYLNGTVDFDSAIGRGTTVIIEVPLA